MCPFLARASSFPCIAVQEQHRHTSGRYDTARCRVIGLQDTPTVAFWLQWHQATSIEVLFSGRNKRRPSPTGSAIVLTRDDAWGTPSGVRAGGGAVVLTV